MERQVNCLRYVNEELEVIWVNGAVFVGVTDSGILFDSPPGTVAALGALSLLDGIRSIGYSSGRLSSIGGMVPLLHEMGKRQLRSFPFEVRGPASDERVAILAEAFQRSWPSQLNVSVDSLFPGHIIDVGPLEIVGHGIEFGDLVGELPGRVVPGTGFVWEVNHNATRIVWAKSCAPSAELRRICQRASLVIIEVAADPWPPTQRCFRMSVTAATKIGGEADELWLVGDDGRLLDGGAVS